MGGWGERGNRGEREGRERWGEMRMNGESGCGNERANYFLIGQNST